MSYLSSRQKKNSNILRLLFEKESINLSPDYQRNGEIWPLEKRQLLIDSILNDYDIPKIYFHTITLKDRKKTGYDYAVIDGRQRIETIFKFVNGEFPLGSDFVYLPDPKIKAGDYYYKDIAENYPILKMAFDSFDLPIICIDTDDLELIDDMFLRLNEAVPLNAAEKRNAIGGPLVKSIKKIVKHDFFLNKVRISNKRFQHLEITVRILFIEHYLKYGNKYFDTKKVFLDELVRKYKTSNKFKVKEIEDEVLSILDAFCTIFANRDILLRSQGIIPIYYLALKQAVTNDTSRKFNRVNLMKFKKSVDNNKIIAETDMSTADYELIEFDRMSLQGTNDASSIKERTRILIDYLDL